MTDTKAHTVTDADWETIRVSLELVDIDDLVTSEHASDRQYADEVEALYEKLQRMGLI